LFFFGAFNFKNAFIFCFFFKKKIKNKKRLWLEPF